MDLFPAHLDSKSEKNSKILQNVGFPILGPILGPIFRRGLPYRATWFLRATLRGIWGPDVLKALCSQDQILTIRWSEGGWMGKGSRPQVQGVGPKRALFPPDYRKNSEK